MDIFAVGAAISKIKLLTDKNSIKTIIIATLFMITMFMTICFLVIVIFISLFFSLDTKRLSVSNIEFMEGLGILSEKHEKTKELYYLAIGPDLFPVVSHHINHSQLVQIGHPLQSIIFEKLVRFKFLAFSAI